MSQVYLDLTNKQTNKRFFKNDTKAEAKKDNKGIKLIKEFLLTMYKKLGAENNKRDDE